MLKDVSRDDFEAEVLKAPIPVLVDFWAPWCGPCRMLEPALKRLGAQFGERLRIVKLDVSTEMDLANKFDVTTTPTLMLFYGERCVGQRVGALPGAAISEWISAALDDLNS